jgi:TolB-like protein/class 3 adenylate cyclase
LSSDHIKRRLSAVLAADVAGSCRLIGIDEEGTLAQLKALRRTIFDPKIAEHHGRVVKNTGDGAIAEFASVVDAVRCAVEVQHDVAKRNTDVPQVKRIEFRIGIHVGDIIIDDNDIFGDGVNIAVRLEGIAEPGGVCISDDARRQIRGKVEVACDDMGMQALKNIAEPMRAWRVRCGVSVSSTSVRPSTDTAQPLALPDRPSIAVLPFINMSGDPDQAYFADGMAEEIITSLSRCGWLFVISRNSSFTYRGKTVDVRQVGRELGVRYVLEGSVRRAGTRLRILGQLADATSGMQIWADRFDGNADDVFELQDRITESVVGAIEPKLQLAEIERLRHKQAPDLDAYDLLLRAQALEYEYTEESLARALGQLERALKIDPLYAPAMALAAYCHAVRHHQGWSNDPQRDAVHGLGLAVRALELAKDDPNVLWMGAFSVRMLGGDPYRARKLLKHSIHLNPNSAIALTTAAGTEVVLGNAEEALILLQRAHRLSPRDPRAWYMAATDSLAYFVAGQYEAAAKAAGNALAQNPRYTSLLRITAASLAKLGRTEEAARAISRALDVEPTLTLSTLRTRLKFMDARVWNDYADGLRRASLPE